MDVGASRVPTPSNVRGAPSRSSLGESRLRTPLPSGPRLEKTAPMSSMAAAPSLPLPNIESIKADLEGSVSQILSSPHRSRYTSVCVLLINWQDEEDAAARAAVEELSDVLSNTYHFSLEAAKIPSSESDSCRNSWRWLARVVHDFAERNDTRDVLKIVYYSGHSFLDEHREMVLARCVLNYLSLSFSRGCY